MLTTNVGAGAIVSFQQGSSSTVRIQVLDESLTVPEYWNWINENMMNQDLIVENVEQLSVENLRAVLPQAKEKRD